MYKILFIGFLISLVAIDQVLAFRVWGTITDFIGVTESCYSKWIPANITGLVEDLESNVFGQPFLISTLIPILKNHYSENDNTKALAMSFHGSPGVGKNFVAGLIAKNIFKKGSDSQFFHFFSGLSDFPRTEKDFYKEFLRDKIVSSVKQCERSMFVFDETDKMPDGLLDVVKSYIDVGRKSEGVDFRKAVFIFLSNIGERLIIDETLSLWKTRVPRNRYNLKQFQDILFAATFNEKGGLKYSTVVRNALINLYLPFLPLERKHVAKCIRAEAKRNNITADEDFVKKILTELDFSPSPENVFASHGCKQIETKVVLQKAMLFNDFSRYDDEL